MENINRSSDAFYRYRMPVVDIKYHRRTTRVENIKGISKSLGRKPDYIMKWFAKELSTCVKIESSSSMVISGTYDKECLKQCLNKFIDIIVLCTQCGNPETVVESNHDNICLNCKACGAMNRIKLDRHPLIKYIHKDIYRKDKDRHAKNKLEIDTCDDRDDEDWSCDTSVEAVRARRQQEFFEPAAHDDNQLEFANHHRHMDANVDDDDFISFDSYDNTIVKKTIVDEDLEDFIDNI